MSNSTNSANSTEATNSTEANSTNSTNMSNTTSMPVPTYNVNKVKFVEALKKVISVQAEIKQFNQEESPLSILKTNSNENSMGYVEYMSRKFQATVGSKILGWMIQLNYDHNYSEEVPVIKTDDKEIPLNAQYPGFAAWVNQKSGTTTSKLAVSFANKYGVDREVVINYLLLAFAKEVLGYNEAGCSIKNLAEELGLRFINISPFAYVDTDTVFLAAKDLGFKTFENKIFVGNYEFIVTDLGVVDNRSRRLMGAMTKCLVTGNLYWAPAQTLFLAALAAGKSENVTENKIAQAMNEKFVWDGEGEAGAMTTGLRSWYNFFVCDRYVHELKIIRSKETGEIFPQSIELMIRKRGGSFEDPLVEDYDEDAFKQWNMLPMHKGKCPFFWARLAVIRCYKMPEKLFKAVTENNADKISKALSHYNETEIHIALASFGIISLTTKLSKFSKRVGLPFAKSADVIGIHVALNAFTHSTQPVVTFGRDKGFEYLTVVAPNAIANPGAAMMLTNEAKKFIVRHKQTVQVAGLTGCEIVADGEIVSTAFNGKKINLFTPNNEVNFVEGEVLATYTSSNVENQITVDQPGQLIGIELTVNSFGETSISVLYQTIEDEVKLRSIFKALVMNTKINAFHHGLNAHLNSQAELLIPADANKSADMLQGMISLMAQTFVKSEQGRKLIKTVNKAVVNEDVSDYLIFDEIAASLGVYDELMKAFYAAHNKAVWLQYEGSEEFMALQSLYTERCGKVSNWQVGSTEVFNTMKTQFLGENVQQVIVNGDVNKDETEILVWTTNQAGAYKFYQRTFALVDVYAHVKPELCSVAQASVNTAMLSSIAHSIELAGDAASARALMNTDKLMQRYAAAVVQRGFISPGPNIQIEVKGTTTTFPVLTLFNGNSQSEELVSLLAPLKAMERKFTFQELKDSIGQYAFHTGNFGVLIQFDVIELLGAGDEELRTNLVGMTTMFFNTLIGGGNKEQCSNLTNSIHGALRSMLTSKKMAKSAMHGVKGVLAKAIANYGIPVGEIFVKLSFHPKSVCQHLTRAEKNWDGRLVAFTRSPIPFPAFLKLVLITPEHPMFECLGIFTFAINGLANAPSGGDFDGDGYAVYFLLENTPLQALTMETALDYYTKRTGLAWNDVEQGSYFADHWTAKGYKAFDSLIGEKNFTLVEDHKNYQKGFLATSKAATILQTLFVGQFHKFAYTGSNLVSLSNAMDHNDSMLNKFKDEDASLCLYEVYEAGLGGMNWDLFEAMQWLYGKMIVKVCSSFQAECAKLSSEKPASWFVDKISKGGCNKKYTEQYITIAQTIRHCDKTTGGLFPKGICNGSIFSAAQAMSYWFFKATKGQCSAHGKAFVDDAKALFGTSVVYRDAVGKCIAHEEIFPFTMNDNAKMFAERSVLFSQFSRWTKHSAAVSSSSPKLFM